MENNESKIEKEKIKEITLSDIEQAKIEKLQEFVAGGNAGHGGKWCICIS